MIRCASSGLWGLMLVAMMATPVMAQEGPPAEVLEEDLVPVPAAVSAPRDGFMVELTHLVEQARTGEAVLRCTDTERAVGVGDLPRAVAELCARAQVGQGDRLYGMGQLEQARAHWHEGLRLDPRLLDFPAFTQRLGLNSPGQGLESLAPLAPAPPPAWPAAPNCPPAPDREGDEGEVVELRPSAPEADISQAAREPVVLPGPRSARAFGAGLGVGFDGLMSAVVGWMHDEFLAVEATVGLVFPTVDARMRFYGMRSQLTPVFGLGMTTPVGAEQDHFDADIDGGFPDLYSHGAIFHVDVGVSYAPSRVVDLYAGASFLLTLDGGDDQLVFFPHWSVQALFYL